MGASGWTLHEYNEFVRNLCKVFDSIFFYFPNVTETVVLNKSLLSTVYTRVAAIKYNDVHRFLA